MSTIIQIKRSSGSSAPSTSDLLEGELAYAEDASNNGAGAKLYIESVNSTGGAVIEAIGGKFYTSAVDSATNSNTACKDKPPSKKACSSHGQATSIPVGMTSQSMCV